MRKVSVHEVDGKQPEGVPFELTLCLCTNNYLHTSEVATNTNQGIRTTRHLNHVSAKDVFHYVVELDGQCVIDPKQYLNWNKKSDTGKNSGDRIYGFCLSDCTESDYLTSVENNEGVQAEHTFRQVLIRGKLQWKKQGIATTEVNIYAAVKKMFKTTMEIKTVSISSEYCDYPLSVIRLDGTGKVIQECDTTIRVVRLLESIPNDLFRKAVTIPKAEYPNGVGVLNGIDEDKAAGGFTTLSPNAVCCTLRLNIDELQWNDVEPYYLMED